MASYKPLYFTIKEFEEEDSPDKLSKLTSNLNKKLAKLKHEKPILEQYAASVKYERYTDTEEYIELIQGLEHVDANGTATSTFSGNITAGYIIENLDNAETNVVIFYTKTSDGNKQLEAIFTYDTGYLDPKPKTRPFVYIHAFTINNDIPLNRRSVSGANIFNWFYKTAKKAGFYCIKINALDSAMKFWRKVKFVYVTDRLDSRGKHLIQLLEEKVSLGKPENEKNNLYNKIREAPMQRIRSTNMDDISITSTESSIAESPDGEILFIPTNKIADIFTDAFPISRKKTISTKTHKKKNHTHNIRRTRSA